MLGGLCFAKTAPSLGKGTAASLADLDGLRVGIRNMADFQIMGLDKLQAAQAQHSPVLH